MNNLLKYLTQEEYESIKENNDLYDKALSLVTILFKDITDKEGLPYLNHLLRVSSNVEEYIKPAALLHDTIEDIEGITDKDLIDIGFPKDIIDIVLLVTKDNNLIYPERITKIINSGNISAIKLKYADISDNYDMNRLNRLDEQTRNRLIDKYKDQIIRLEKKLKER